MGSVVMAGRRASCMSVAVVAMHAARSRMASSVHSSPAMVVPVMMLLWILMMIDLPLAMLSSTMALLSCRRHTVLIVLGTADTPAGRRCIWSWLPGSSHSCGMSSWSCWALLRETFHSPARDHTPNRVVHNWHTHRRLSHRTALCARGRHGSPFLITICGSCASVLVSHTQYSGHYTIAIVIDKRVLVLLFLWVRACDTPFEGRCSGRWMVVDPGLCLLARIDLRKDEVRLFDGRPLAVGFGSSQNLAVATGAERGR